MLFIEIILRIYTVLFVSFPPIGNEKSTVRRLPWITFFIIGINVLIYYGTLPTLAEDLKAMAKQGMKLQEFLLANPELLADEEVREKLLQSGILSKGEDELLQSQLKLYGNTGRNLAKDDNLKKEFNQIMGGFLEARESSLWYKYGFAPNGQWKAHQLITAAFFHGNFEHLFYNMLIFFAIAFTLEDLWGRGIFLGFYLMSAAASCIPSIFAPEPLVGIGASGAIFATMGAFLVRLPKTKIKLFIVPGWLIRWILESKKNTLLIPGYIYLLAFFILQFIFLYYVKKMGAVPTVGFTVHIAGFIFGAGFAAIIKASKIEEEYINPKIEAKVTFTAHPDVTRALELLDKGDMITAEQMLKHHLFKHPDSAEAILGLIQIYERTSNFDQLNAMYSRLIRYHLSKQDKDAALFAYDTLLQAFPDDNVAVRIPTRDWLAICEYLREAEMNREASVEYERLMKAWPDDPVAVRAALQGADAALMANDTGRALKMYEKAQAMNPPQPMVSRIEAGIEKCTRILDNRPKWAKEPPKAPTIYRGY